MPSDMKGTRMNQLVAPTSFITDTSRRRAKMAMRMVFRMSTAAEISSTTATTMKTHWRMVMTFCSAVDLRQRRRDVLDPGLALEPLR